MWDPEPQDSWWVVSIPSPQMPQLLLPQRGAGQQRGLRVGPAVCGPGSTPPPRGVCQQGLATEPIPAGACWPGRPRGRAPAPASRPRPSPGPQAARGCSWALMPPCCLQGKSTATGWRPQQASPPPRPPSGAQEAVRGKHLPGNSQGAAGRGQVPRRAGREAVSREWNVWPPEAPRSC